MGIYETQGHLIYLCESCKRNGWPLLSQQLERMGDHQLRLPIQAIEHHLSTQNGYDGGADLLRCMRRLQKEPFYKKIFKSLTEPYDPDKPLTVARTQTEVMDIIDHEPQLLLDPELNCRLNDAGKGGTRDRACLVHNTFNNPPSYPEELQLFLNICNR